MNSKIIDGRILATKHEKILRQKLAKIKKTRNPAIVSFCNIEDPPSVKYTFMKLTKARQIGIDFMAEEFSASTDRNYITDLVTQHAGDSDIDGIMVQLPLPPDLNIFKEDLLNLIPLEKDVDGLREGSNFLSATVRAVLTILDEEIADWKEKFVAVVGSQGEVGKPLCNYLAGQNIKFLKIDKYKGNLSTDLKKADIIISATGEKNLIKQEMIKSGAVLIDVGLGDFDPECCKKALKYTPVLGGVGPMTVISLMENVVESYKRRI